MWVPVHHSRVCFLAADGGYSSHIWSATADVFNKQFKEHSARIKVNDALDEEVDKCIH
jgi:hypothetical protein